MHCNQILYRRSIYLIHLVHIGGGGGELDFGEGRGGGRQGEGAPRPRASRQRVTPPLASQLRPQIRPLAEGAGRALGHKNFRSRTLKDTFISKSTKRKQIKCKKQLYKRIYKV